MKTHSPATRILLIALSIAFAIPALSISRARTANMTASGVSLFSLLSGIVSTPKAQHRSSRALSLEERVSYQWAIEEVYWQHKLWPAENKEPKPELSAVMPLSLVRAKVEDTLRKSDLLERHHKQTITGDQLQAEIERMAGQTRRPDLLRALWRALSNDPYLIAECLARPTLVDRLVRNWYGTDQEVHRELKARAESDLISNRTPTRMKLMSGHYTEAEWTRAASEPSPFDGVETGATSGLRVINLSPVQWDEEIQRLAATFSEPDNSQKRTECYSCASAMTSSANAVVAIESLPVGRVSELQEDDLRFYVTAVLSSGRNRIKTATVEWRKVDFDQWWESEKGQFGPQVQTSAYSFKLPPLAPNTSTDDTWTQTKSLPAGVFGPKAVWTGTEMIVWGGGSTAGAGVNTGARYNPAIDTWTSMSTENAPMRRINHSAVWTGLEMIVWGGCDTTGHLCGLSSGGRYNPVTDTWTTTTTANAPTARRNHTAVWTGSVMIVWGGCVPGFDGRCPPLNTGGVYNPATDSWTPTSTTNAPSERASHTAVWSGGVMIIWGGTVDSTGGRYNPNSDSWQPTSTINVPSGRASHTAVWTGAEMIVWGGVISSTVFDTGARYNPTSDIWTPTSATGAPAARYLHSAVWTGTEMIVWGGWDIGSGVFNTGGRYNPASDSWMTITTTNAPSARGGHQALWTGSLMIIWGSAGDKSGGRYDPSSNSWTPTNANDAVEARTLHVAVWTGTEMIVWAGEGQLSGTLNTGGRYDPATDVWQPTSATNAPFGRIFPAAVWTGLEMIVWGGQYGSVCFDDGGRYNPTTNTWTATNPVGAPSERSNLTGVWTGTEMIVWGGSCGNTLNTGGRYNPATNSWQPTSIVNAPTARYLHSAVWAGSEMIVWGGAEFGTGVYFNTGGRYNPVTDTWQPTGAAGAPSARIGNAAVWTGTEMVVWGGWTYGSPSVYFNTGGRYSPTTNSWLPTSTNNVPAARKGHTGIWTGSLMVVWGGVADSSTLGPSYSTGGRYSPVADTWASTNTAGAPSAREGHTAVWTGNEMIVWGGYPPSTGTYTATGGRYSVTSDPGFNISASPSSLTVAEGASGTSTITVSSLNGFSSAVILSCAGAPVGVTWGFVPNPVMPPSNSVTFSTLTVGVGSGVAPGTYSILVQATSGTLTRSFLLLLSVPPAGTFYVTAYPELVAAAQGAGTTSEPRVWSQNDFNLPVTLSCSGAPSGVTFSFLFNPLTPPPSGSVTDSMIIDVASSVTPGIYPFQLVGTSGSLVRTFAMQLTVLPAGCSYSLAPIYSDTFPPDGASSSVTVSTSPGCGWQAVSNADWITITSGGSGNGNGTVNYTVSPNPSISARLVRMTIAGQPYQIYQTGAVCPFTIVPTSHSFIAAGWTGVVSVTAPGACNWTATSNDSWIAVLSVSTTNGSGAVTYSVAANTAASPRSGTITIAGQTFTVNQQGTAASCAYSLLPIEQNSPANGGSSGVSVSAGSGCSWSAISNDSWITDVDPPSGSGDGTVTFMVASNSGGAARTGTITIGGQTFTVNQAGNPTVAKLTAASATAYDGGVMLEWHTGMEIDNLGFRIYSDVAGHLALLNSQIIAGSALVAGSGTVLTAGQAYAWWIDAKDVAKDAAFWLEDIDINGTSSWHGPYFAKYVGGQRPAQPRAALLSSVGRNDSGDVTPVIPSVGPPVRLNDSGAIRDIDFASMPAIKIGVQKMGWHRLTQTELFNAGLDPNIDPRTLRLFVDGKELPIYIAGEHDGRLDQTDSIQFYGLGLDTASTDTRVYWLIAGTQPGLRIQMAPPSKGFSFRQSFPYTVERRERTVYFSALRNGDAENFFGAVITSNTVSQTLTISNLALDSRAAAVLEVALQGVTSTAHRVGVALNDSFVGYIDFGGQARGVERFSLPQSLLRAGANTVALQAINGPSDVSLVDAIRLTYQHSFSADDDMLSLTAQPGETVTITGFSSADVRVFDVTTAGDVTELEVSIGGVRDGFSGTITAQGAGERRLLALTGARALRATSIKANVPSRLHDPTNGADFIIIGHSSLLGSLKSLADLRAKQGLISTLVDIEDIYDEFSFGNKSPESIRDFLSFAVANWKLAPRFVLFVGDASYDARNYLGAGDNDLVPTRLIDTSLMETASDDWFADFNEDGIADLNVGRLPVRTIAEAQTVLSKIIRYDSASFGGPAERRSVLLVADLNDGFNFEQASEQLRTLVSSDTEVQEIFRGRLDDETARTQLIASINAGQSIVNYTGHGSTNAWRSLFATSDIRSLEDRQSLPLFITMTCLNGFIQDPVTESLAEGLMKAEHGGAVAVWASSGLTVPSEQALINQQIYRLIFAGFRLQGEPLTLGEAAAKAKSATQDPDVRRTWLLLGDPTMRLR